MPDPLARILEARSRLEAAERETDKRRAAFYRAIARAHDEHGISLAEIGRTLGITRQRAGVLAGLGRRSR
jgi:hypothetical protein